MKNLIYYGLILLIATYLGLMLHQYPSYLFIQMAQWVIKIPLWLTIIGLLIIFWLIHTLCHLYFTLFNSHGSVRHWYQQRTLKKTQLLTLNGLLFLWLGYWQKAEKFLLKGASANHDNVIINYLALAKTAKAQAHHYDKYLNQAKKRLANQPPYYHMAVALREACLPIQQQ